MHLSYANIIKEAWQITLKNRILWFFAIFASFISLEAVYEVVLGQLYYLKQTAVLQEKILGLYYEQAFYFKGHLYFLNSFSQDFSAYIFFILLLTLIFFFIWLAFISQIFIIKSTAKIYRNKNLDLNNDLSGSYEKFWPVLGVNILIKLLLYAGFIAFSLPLLYAILTQSSTALIASYFIFFILFTAFAIVISFIAAYATNFIVLKDYHIIEALKSAWYLFSKNIILSLEIALMLFFLKIISIIAIFCLAFVVIIPLAIIFTLALASSNIIGIIMSLTLMILFFSIISLIVNAIFAAFYLSSWTLAFLKITEESFTGKIIYWLKQVPQFVQKFSKKQASKIDTEEIKIQSKILAKKTKKEAVILAQKLEEKYKEYQPKAKVQAKIVGQQLKEVYNKLEPQLEKEIKKIIKQKKANGSKKTKTKTKSAAKKKTTAAKPKTKAKKKTVPKSKSKK